MYIGVHSDVARESGCTSNKHNTLIKEQVLCTYVACFWLFLQILNGLHKNLHFPTSNMSYGANYGLPLARQLVQFLKGCCISINCLVWICMCVCVCVCVCVAISIVKYVMSQCDMSTLGKESWEKCYQSCNKVSL